MRTAATGMTFTHKTLTSRVWSFGPIGAEPYATQFRLFDNGRIGGYAHPNEQRWDIRHGRLVLLGRDGTVTTIFDQASTADGHLYFEGRFADGSARHCLREAEPIGALLPAAAGVTATAREGLVARRNLVILRAGPSSLHTAWARDIPPEDRSWDLCISWYADPERFIEDPDAEYHAVQPDVRKFGALHQLLHRDSPFWRYDYVMAPDDDLAWSWRGVNIAFETMREFNLLLGQPSLDPSGFPNHDITRQRPDCRLRFTNFVEVMTPIFSREALEICAPTFGLSRGGFGLDHVWSTLLGDPSNRLGIIDDTAAVHTRPIAAAYNLGEAVEEGLRLAAAYKAPARYDVLGSIDRRN